MPVEPTLSSLHHLLRAYDKTASSMTDGTPNHDRPRYVTASTFPPYSYVPGKFPHPHRDPRGHSHGIEPPVVTVPQPAAWRDCRPYLWGIDLFNHGYYWESHETWETLWHACGRRGRLADFLKGLIKFAAAGVKAREGRPQGVRRHALGAHRLFAHPSLCVEEVGRRYMGLSLTWLTEKTVQLAEQPSELVNVSQRPVEIIFPFVLRPK